MNNTETPTTTTKHIAIMTRRNGWGVQCWNCDFKVANSKSNYKADVQRIAREHTEAGR